MMATHISFADGLRQHYVLLFGFKHDGQGLPSKGSSLVYGLIVFHLLLSGIVGLLQPDLNGTQVAESLVFQALWLLSFYFFISVPLKFVEVLVGGLMLTLVSQVVAVVIGLIGLQEQLAPVSLALGVWVLAAQFCLLRRHTVRTVLSKKA